MHFTDKGYTVHAFLPRWAIDGGRERRAKVKLHMAQCLHEAIDRGQLHLAPAGVDDDEFVLSFALQMPGALILSNDLYRDHVAKGKVKKAWLDEHLLPFMFVGDALLVPASTALEVCSSSGSTAYNPGSVSRCLATSTCRLTHPHHQRKVWRPRRAQQAIGTVGAFQSPCSHSPSPSASLATTPRKDAQAFASPSWIRPEYEGATRSAKTDAQTFLIVWAQLSAFRERDATRRNAGLQPALPQFVCSLLASVLGHNQCQCQEPAESVRVMCESVKVTAPTI